MHDPPPLPRIDWDDGQGRERTAATAQEQDAADERSASPLFHDLLRRLLRKDPRKRPTWCVARARRGGGGSGHACCPAAAPR